jgi:hypothetical protein
MYRSCGLIGLGLSGVGPLLCRGELLAELVELMLELLGYDLGGPIGSSLISGLHEPIPGLLQRRSVSRSTPQASTNVSMNAFFGNFTPRRISLTAERPRRTLLSPVLGSLSLRRAVRNSSSLSEGRSART